MTTSKTPFCFTRATLLKVFGLAIRYVMKRPPHCPKLRTGVSAKGPWGRHRGSQFRGYRRAPARGYNTYAEHDLLVRNFGAAGTRNFERGMLELGSHPQEAMSAFLAEFRRSGDEYTARDVL